MKSKISYSGESVYVLRCKVGDTYGWYVGCTYGQNPWGRIAEHISKDYNHNRFVKQNTIVGIDAVFLFGCDEKDTHYSACVEKNERFVARAFIERYSLDRVYGGGFSKKAPPAEKSKSQPTMEFARDVRKTEYSWLLNHSDYVRNSFYSTLSAADTTRKIKWKNTSPALPE